MDTLMNNHAVHGAMVAAPSAYVISSYGVNTPRSILGGLAIGGLVYYQMTSAEADEKVNRQVDVTDPAEVANIGTVPTLGEQNLAYALGKQRRRRAEFTQAVIPDLKGRNRHVQTKVQLSRANRVRNGYHDPVSHGLDEFKRNRRIQAFRHRFHK